MTLEEQIEVELQKLEPALRQSISDAIKDLQSGVMIAAVIDALQNNDIEKAIDLLNIDPIAFQWYNEGLRNVMITIGAIVASAIPNLRSPQGRLVYFRFNPQDKALDKWFDMYRQGNINSFMTTINENVRSTIVAGQSIGRTPKQIAYDIFGLWNGVDQTRDGSVFGLSSSNLETVLKVQKNLFANDKDGLKHYLTLTRRDPTFDEIVNEAIRTGKKININTVSTIVTMLKMNYERLRTDSIASSQASIVANTVKDYTYRQSITRASLSDSNIEREWVSMRDDDVRHTHQGLDGQKKSGFDEPFVSASGALMRFPGDTSLGAGLDEILGCRCRARYGFKASEWL